MSDEFIIEQPAEFNQYLYAPRSWTARWRMAGLWLPVGLGLAAMGLGVEYLDDEMQKVNWCGLIFLCAAFPAGGILFYEFNCRTRLKRVKKLHLDSNHVKTSVFNKIPWSEIRQFSFLKLPDSPGLIQLALDYKTIVRRQKTDTSWFMVLDEAQTAALQQAVAQFGQADKIKPELEPPGPLIGEVPREYSWVTWCIMTAFLQFPVGLGFLVFALFPGSPSSAPKNEKSFPHENLVVHFLIKDLHLRTPAMLNLFFGLLGSALLIASGILFYIGSTTLNRVQKSRRHLPDL